MLGLVFFSVESGMAWNLRVWGHLDDVLRDGEGGAEGCRLYSAVPGPL